jgi:hypothetical protein
LIKKLDELGSAVTLISGEKAVTWSVGTETATAAATAKRGGEMLIRYTVEDFFEVLVGCFVESDKVP